MLAELAALGAATLWAAGGLLSTAPARHLGALAFNRLRMAFVFFMLAAASLYTGGWQALTAEHLWLLTLSGAIGIFLGDTALFASLTRLGPRRSAILFAANAPISALLGYLFLGETLSLQALTGVFLVMSGVVLAIMFGSGRDRNHAWEKVDPSLLLPGIAFGIVAAASQSVGSIVAKPVLLEGIDAITASTVRVGVAMVLLLAMMAHRRGRAGNNRLNLRVTGMTALSGFINMVVGMTLVVYALRDGEVGIVATLSAMTPVMILPLIWTVTGRAPAAGAWAGAVLSVAGSALIFLN